MKRVIFSIAFLLPGAEIVSAPAAMPGSGEQAPRPDAATDYRERLQATRSALDRGFPHAVLHSLRALATKEMLPPEEKRAVFLLLLQAELAAGNPEAVLQLVGNAPEFATEPEAGFWRAGALVQANRPEEALDELLRLAAMEDFVRREESVMMAAPLLAGAGEMAVADQMLSSIPTTSPMHLPASLERAALLLGKGKAKEAKEILEGIAEAPPACQERHIYLLARARHDLADYEGALLVLGEQRSKGEGAESEAMAVLRALCLARLGQEAMAIAGLETFLLQARGGASRSGAFGLLETLLPRQSSPSLGELRRMAAESAEPARAMEATLALAKVEMQIGHPQAAREHLEKMLSLSLPEDIRQRAIVLLARLEMQEDQPGVALDLLRGLEEPPAQADFWRGCALLVLQRHEEAAEAFRAAVSDPALRIAAAFNGLLASELAGGGGEEPGFGAILAAVDPDGLLRNETLLQAALEKARTGQEGAAGRLRDLAPLLGSEAAVPLAEWLYVNNQPDEASQVLEEWGAGGGAQQEARAFLEIFLADDPAQSDTSRAAELARSFLRIFPDSPRALEVKLKLGEIAQRDGDYLSAYEFFSDVAGEAPDPQTAAHAWYLAGKAAARLMDSDALERAILAFEEAAQGGGEVAVRARYEQALLFNARGDSEEAVILLDRVAADTKDPGLRAAALIEKGDSFYSRGAEDAEMFRRAIEAWHPLVGDTMIGASWREQALTKTGLARIRLGETEMALESFYTVVLGERSAPGGIWFERAGFEAGRLLEERKAWSEAVRLYQILADAGGPRAEEAATRANRVRLENFLWEG